MLKARIIVAFPSQVERKEDCATLVAKFQHKAQLENRLG